MNSQRLMSPSSGSDVKQEGPMFQMINEEKPSAEDRKMLWVKVGLFIVLCGALGGVVYFFATTPFGK